MKIRAVSVAYAIIAAHVRPDADLERRSPDHPAAELRLTPRRRTTRCCASAAATRCTGCTRSGAAPPAGSRPTAAAGNGHPRVARSFHPTRPSRPTSDRMQQLVAELRERTDARARGRRRRIPAASSRAGQAAGSRAHRSAASIPGRRSSSCRRSRPSPCTTTRRRARVW